MSGPCAGPRTSCTGLALVRMPGGRTARVQGGGEGEEEEKEEWKRTD